MALSAVHCVSQAGQSAQFDNAGLSGAHACARIELLRQSDRRLEPIYDIVVMSPKEQAVAQPMTGNGRFR